MLNPSPWRHYRRRYARGEVVAGAAVLCMIAAVGLWVRWMGAHPDPALARVPLEALAGDPAKSVSRVSARAAPAGGGHGSTATETASPAARGALPGDLAPPGFTEGRPAVFDSENLYEKIDGRANYFTSRGFETLSFVSLMAAPGGAAPGTSIDLELYDMGNAENALGAYGGEKSAEVVAETHPAGLWHLDRNALYLTQGRYYLRAIASDEAEATRAALLHVKERVQAAFASQAQELPWAHRLFGQLGIAAGRIEFHREGAFSFGFASDVYSALLDDGATELWVMAAADEASARALADQFVAAFASYGETVKLGGETWVRDRYLSSLATARAQRAFVFGVRGAPTEAGGEKAILRLAAALESFPPVPPSSRGGKAASGDSSSGGGDHYDVSGDVDG
ncbi:MAG: hypothetical protein IPK07_00630 [Deltaproteobacteria bacterium]|nr:hypothetical protein [Deltaproteobacteria bacterium]